ncbi:phosphoenolpyruvate carboxykinase (ATP) [soil metagenome]
MNARSTTHTNGSAILEEHGIVNVGDVYRNLTTPRLYEESIMRRESRLAHKGPLVVRTGHHTGRSPQDRFFVQEPSSEDRIWWGETNRPISQKHWESLRSRMLAYLQGHDLFVQDCYVGADSRYRMPIRIITEGAWHSLFAHNMFIRPTADDNMDDPPRFTVIQAPGFHAVPEIDGTRSDVFVVLNFAEQTVLIGGTEYAGEIKKSIFTIMNYLMPLQNVMSMHCSANMGSDGDVAIFFGLSGTGKTTLSADPQRTLIGDDEHGWSDDGVFNFEGGCYAKVINLDPAAEPEIYETTRKFGTILENVAIDVRTGRLDLDDASLTENTRAAYPITHIPNASLDGIGAHSSTVIMLTADAFGIMPPIARLTTEQAMYHFLSGYTAKVAGTERGVTEPVATFSTCFGAPFMALSPIVYARLLGERIRKHGSNAWLVNTGWTGGPYGTGNRMKIAYTRAMINAALSGVLNDVPTRREPVFGFEVPVNCPDVPDDVLDPRDTWSNPGAYDKKARELATMFVNNFAQFAPEVSDDVKNAAPVAV